MFASPVCCHSLEVVQIGLEVQEMGNLLGNTWHGTVLSFLSLYHVVLPVPLRYLSARWLQCQNHHVGLPVSCVVLLCSMMFIGEQRSFFPARRGATWLCSQLVMDVF